MKSKDKINWGFVAPRTLGVIYMLFIGIFALDVFVENSWTELLIALFMHLLPSIILAVLLVIFWKNSKVLGLIFLVLALAFSIFFHSYEDMVVFLLISFPLLIISGMFYRDAKCQK